MEKFSSNKQTTAEILREIVSGFYNGEEFYNSLGIVKAVNSAEKTCSVQISNGDLVEDVRLQQVASDGGLFVSPKIGSSVIVGWTDSTTASISMYSEIDYIVLQNGNNGGLIKIVEQTSKLNSLVSELQAELLKISTGITGVGGTYTPSTLSILNKADFENEKFMH